VCLGIVTVGLLVWGLAKNSDLNDAQDQLDQQAQTGTAVVTAAQGAYDDVTKQLDATNEDLDATKQQVEDANAAADTADKQADAAKQQAAQATDQTEKAQAEAAQAQAEVKAAQSKAAVAAQCAKAYVGALSNLFDGDDVKAQATAVRDQLQSISTDCKAAFAAS